MIDLLYNFFFSGYTVYNTLTYSVILIFFLFLILKLFKKLSIDPINIFYCIIPFVFFGSSLRALVDNNILQYSLFFITPGIYFLVGILAILSLLISYKLKNIINYKISIFIFGLILAIYPLSKIHYINFNILLIILIIWIILTLIFYTLSYFINIYKDKINLSIISAHLLDASTTFIAVDFFTYNEQHVLPNALYDIFNSAISIYPLKIIVISLAIYLIDKYIDDKYLLSILKLAIFILGLAPGSRNLLTLAIGL